MTSTTEVEIVAVFRNTYDAVISQHALEFTGYLQLATPIQVDNKYALGILTNSVKHRRSKATDIRFYWVKCRIKQGPFYIYWIRGRDNIADYFTKHYSPSNYKVMRYIYLINSVYLLQEIWSHYCHKGVLL